MVRIACDATRAQQTERERTSVIVILLSGHLSCFLKQMLFVEGNVLPQTPKGPTPNGVRAYVLPDTHIVDRSAPHSSSHKKIAIRAGGGHEALTPPPYPLHHVQSFVD